MTKAEITFIRSLAAKKERLAAGLFVAEGEKLVGEMLNSALTVHKLFVVAGTKRQWPEQTETISSKEMERISGLKTPSDVLALVGIPRYTLPEDLGQKTLVLALDDVQDPGNMGTIIRLADWFGIRDVICSEATADCFHPKVVQATMGAIARVRVHYGSLEVFLSEALQLHVPVYGTFLDGEDIYDTPLSAHGILVMGNEGQGIGPQVAQRITHRLYLPPYPPGEATSESLNVAVATAVICAEFRRRLK